MRILANLNVVGTLDLDNVTNAAADTDRFLVQDANGVVRYRTGAEVASDIGAAVGFVSTLKHEVKLSVAVGKGKAVYISGSDGTNMLASLASNASEATSTKTLGLTESAGAQNAKVFVVSEGLLAGLDTSTATIGDPVWLGVDGELIYGLANKPYAPAHMVFVGLVTRVNANNGEIFVKVQNGFELQELHNVQITTTPANNTVLAYETSSSLYKMKSIATLLGYTPADDAGVVHLAGTETITGTKTFTAATTTFAKVVANSPAGGATGEGIVVGKSFKLDASGEGEKAKIYVVTKDLSDTYGSGLQIQFANIDDNKGFGFNLNTAGGYEIYTKDAGAAWVKAMTISNTQLATFHGNVRLAAYTTNGFVKTSSSNGTITIDPAAFTLTTTGTNGPATYNSGTGVLNIPEYLGASGIRIVYNFTATAGQTTFTVTSYTPGVIDVYYNGSRLTEDEYTATNGTTIVLDTACAVGDLVDVIVYQGSINGFTGVGGSGTINQLTYWTGANTIGALSTATYPSLTEISYVKGVTSAIQTQLDAKVPTSRTLTINGTSYDLSANRSWTISGVTGSGTANQIAYWDGSSSVAGSTFLTLNLTADNGYLILTGGATYKNADIWLNRYSDAWENAIRFQTNGTTDWYLGSSATGSNSNLEFYSYGTTSAALTLLKASANANFGASVGIGNTTLTGYSLRVSRTMVGDTASGITSFGVVSDGTVQSAVTSGAFGFNSALSTAAAAFTLDSLIHFRATQGTIGNTSAVTNQYGFAALGTMTGATNNYGFFGSLDSATGRWNLYMSGTARNYLAGDTSIGTTTGGYKLNVSGTANISGVLTGTTGTFSSTLTGTGLRSFAVNTAQTPSNNAGWYTLARFNTYAPFLNTNGNSGIITLSFYGGGIYTPSRYRIFYFKDDANVATLKLEKYGAVDYIQEVRIRYRTGDTRYYIEIYCDSHASGLTFDVHHDRLFGYGDQLEIFGGVLDAASGTGTILATLPFVDHGTTMSSLNVVTSASFSSALTANSFVKSGGIASQFLKADGTVDDTTYQPALTNPVTGTGTINQIAYWTSSSEIGALSTATYPSLTELSYVKGVTSGIQAQLNAKQASFGNQTANTVYAGPTTGAAAAPTFRALVASDIPNLDTSKITTGTLTVSRGGTGASSFGSNEIIYGNSASALQSSNQFTFSPTGVFLINNTISAGGIATNFTSTVNAAANNDIIYGVRISPTFNNLSFTGVTQRALGVFGDVYINGTITGAGWGGSTITVAKGGTGLTALGTAGQLIRVNSGATALEYFTPSYLTSNFDVTGTVRARTAKTTYRDNSGNPATDAPIRSLTNTEDNWIYLDSASTEWGIYHRNIDSSLVVAGQQTLKANSIAFIGANNLQAYICLADGELYAKSVNINGNTAWHAGNLTPQTQLNGTGFVKASGTTISYDNNNYTVVKSGSLTLPAGSYNGWYRIGISSQAVGGFGGRGAFKFVIAQTGNNITPSQVVIEGYKDWSSGLFIGTVEDFNNANIFTQFRLAGVGDYTYLEAYINWTSPAGGQDLAVYSYDNGHNGNTWSVLTGNITAATSPSASYSMVKVANTKSITGLNVANSAAIGANLNVLGTLFMKDSGPSIYENRINAGWNSTGDAIDMWINYEGYQNSNGYFRDFRVGNGKRGSAIMFIDGSEGTTTFSGSVTANTVTANSFTSGTFYASGAFTIADADQWPYIYWHRDTGNGWDEGLIKNSSARGFFGRSGFGIHMSSTRAFHFFSSGWDSLLGIEGGTGTVRFKGSPQLQTNNLGVLLNASGSSSSGAAFGFQQTTSEGWTGIFVDYEPYTGWGLYHDNPNNYFCVTSEGTTGQLRSFTVPSRSSGNRTAYEKIRFDQNNGSILAGGDITAFSDGRVKTDIKLIENAVEKVKAIRGVTFLRKDSIDEYKDKRHAGVIAQEVLEVLPEVVNKDNDTGMYNVAYGNLTALLIEAIKELAEENKQIKEELSKLKN